MHALKPGKSINNRNIGSSADPTSLCVAAHLFSRSPSLPEQARAAYHRALSQQLLSLLTRSPRFPNGAISHRDAYPSLWADSIYMVPPILAYHGVSTCDIGMAKESVRQCQLYCEVLVMPSGLWRHIANEETSAKHFDAKTDDGAWCTSNAWAAAGMARVLATLRSSQFAAETATEQGSLLDMTKAILDAAIQADSHSSGLLRNYLDDDSWFGDVAGTALMASAAFRMAVLNANIFGEKHTAWATAKMHTVARHVDPETGIAAPVVNSLKERQPTPLHGINPEAQAFVVLLYTAYRDWKVAVESISA